MPPNKGIMGLPQRVYPELIAQFQEPVHAGTTDPVEVQHLLKNHVHHYMSTGSLPKHNDRAYYPTLFFFYNEHKK